MLIHLAWEGLPNYDSDFHYKTNLWNDFEFISNMINNGLKSLTISGTCFEYGLDSGCLNEHDSVIPVTAYGIAKNMLRQLLSEYISNKNISFHWIRLFYIFGENNTKSKLLSQLKHSIDSNFPQFNMSPGDQLIDYLHISQIAEHISKIALQDNVTGIINCCSGKPIMLKTFIKNWLEDQNVSMKLNLGHYPYSEYESKKAWGSTKKLNRILNCI